MKKALTAKWVFNYTNNKVLWRKVVCAKSKCNPGTLLPVLGNKGNNSILLGFIDSALGQSERVRELIKYEFRIMIGDWQDTDFWCDN